MCAAAFIAGKHTVVFSYCVWFFATLRVDEGFCSFFCRASCGLAWEKFLRKSGRSGRGPLLLWYLFKKGKRLVNRKGVHILVVDDDPAVLWLTEEMLAGLGHRPSIAASGSKALDLARANPGKIDILLTDVVMPDMDGPQLAEEFLVDHPEAKILFMSGFLRPSVLNKESLRKRSAFLLKPFTIAELGRRVKHLLASK